MRRRDLVLLSASTAFAWPLWSSAQNSSGPPLRPVIGVLALSASEHDNAQIEPFLSALTELGYIDGKTATIARRYADFDAARLPKLAAEVATLRPNVIMADTASPIKAAHSAAPDVPIVGASMSYPIEQGLVNSFSKPGGTVTGLAAQVEDMDTKILELMSEIVHEPKSVGLLLNPNATLAALEERDLRAAAARLGIGFVAAQARQPSEIEGAINKLANMGISFLALQPNALFLAERKRIVQIATAANLPTASTQAGGSSDMVRAGVFLIYSVDFTELYRRAAVFVDKIIKGAKPGDLPVEFPTQLRLALNLKSAKALGITVPQSVLLRADELIE
jgi:putative ABC transport system substrate-binding protein